MPPSLPPPYTSLHTPYRRPATLAFQETWIEGAIGESRDPDEIAAAIASHPEFVALIRESLAFAETDMHGDKARVTAEHIVHKLHQAFGGFVTSH